jgi:hypothetical protein
MPRQPPTMRVAKVPGAVDLSVGNLNGTDIVSIANGGPVSAQTTLDNLGEFLQPAASEPINARLLGAAGDGTTDDTEALQEGINQASTSIPSAQALYLPGGTYRITAPLALPRQYVSIFGDGPWQSIISYNGVSGGALVAVAQSSMRPVFRDFSVMGNSASGNAIDFSAVSGDVYLAEFRNMLLQAGAKALFVPNNIFSSVIQNVWAGSLNDHAFLLAVGPAVSMISCYALTTGVGKAGYRMIGTINLYSCNGVNSGDYWGIFGNDPSAVDGFQNDFPGVTNYPDVTMIGCNVESFAGLSTTVDGILLHNGIRQFLMQGGSVQPPATAYKSVIRQRKDSNGGLCPVRLAPGRFNAVGTPSTAYLAADTGGPQWEDTIGTLAVNGITTFQLTVGPSTYPIGAITFSSLPSAGTVGEGARRVIYDSSVTTFGSDAAGGASAVMPVLSTGTKWIIG